MLDLDQIESRIRSSRKYEDIHPSVVRRQVEQLADRFGSDKALDQAVRKKLHQAFGAYLGGNWLRKLEKGIDGELTSVRDTCLELMALHASTRERVSDLADVTAALAEHIPENANVLDLACGLNALTLPWIADHRACHYVGVDLHKRMVDAVGRLTAGWQTPVSMQWGDVLAGEAFKADVVLMLKLLPCLEHQEEGASMRMIRGTEAEKIIVSYPTRSIGGRAKGMDHTYHRQIEMIAQEAGRDLTRIGFDSEILFVLC